MRVRRGPSQLEKIKMAKIFLYDILIIIIIFFFHKYKISLQFQVFVTIEKKSLQ